MNRRDAIRAATLGKQKNFKRETVVIDGQEIEVRQPNVKSRAAIMKAAKALGGDMDRIEIDALVVTALIHCCYEPGTENKIFSDADREALLDQPAGGFVDELGEVAMHLLNVDASDVRKNSEGIQNAS